MLARVTRDSLSCPRTRRDTLRLPGITSTRRQPVHRRTFMNVTAGAAAALAFKPLALAEEQERKSPVAMAARQSLYAVYVDAQGAQMP